MIELGWKVRDQITGFEGIAIARTEWLYGCTRYVIEPNKLDKDGKLPDPHSFDEQRLIVLERSPKFISPDMTDAAKKPGGPRPDPHRYADPTIQP